MAFKTYIPHLLKILEVVCRYVARYRNQLARNLTEDQLTKLDAIVTACNIFIAAVGVLPIGG